MSLFLASSIIQSVISSGEFTLSKLPSGTRCFSFFHSDTGASAPTIIIAGFVGSSFINSSIQASKTASLT